MKGIGGLCKFSVKSKMVLFAQMKLPITNLKLNKLITGPKRYNYVVKCESDILKTILPE